MKLQLPKGTHKSMREHVFDTLRMAIISGELKPGQRLTEVEIGSQLGTSRAPVREALRQLATEGFVEIHPYRETLVSRVEPKELKEVLVPIRTLVEVFALRRLFESGEEHILAALHTIVREMKEAARSSDRFAVIERDLEFHRTLVESLEFTHPIRIWSSITPVIYRAFFVGTTSETLSETVEGHVRLLELIELGDREAAEALLREHIEEMELRFVVDANTLNDATETERTTI